jgi:hypothetical protein
VPGFPDGELDGWLDGLLLDGEDAEEDGCDEGEDDGDDDAEVDGDDEDGELGGGVEPLQATPFTANDVGAALVPE